MFKDIKLSIDNNKINFGWIIEEDAIIIRTTDELKIDSILKIFYDENIYEIKLNKNTKYNLGKKGELFIHLDNKELNFSVILKNNYFVKSVYKYINKLTNKDTLIEEINIFLNSKVGKKYNKDITNLLLSIENKDKGIEDLILDNENEYERIFNLLINNKTYINIAKDMSYLELMLLITSYIFVPSVPKIDQESFNNLVNVAKTYDNALENIWRLGMNYDGRDYDYNLLDDFFVNSKNIWYLGEYISGINQVKQENQDTIVNKIINTADKDFIKQILKDNFIVNCLDKKYIEILEKSV